MTLVITPDDFGSIISALVVIAEDGTVELQKHPTLEAATQMAALHDLIARLLKHIKHPDEPAYRHNAAQCARMVADMELAKIAGTSVDLNIELGEIR